IATVIIAKSVTPGFKSSTVYNHYSLLKTVEQAWGLAPLTANDRNALSMAEFFSPPAAGASNTLRVNAGGGASTGADGRVGAADAGFNAGRTYSTTTAISATSDQPLYQSE